MEGRTDRGHKGGLLRRMRDPGSAGECDVMMAPVCVDVPLTPIVLVVWAHVRRRADMTFKVAPGGMKERTRNLACR